MTIAFMYSGQGAQYMGMAQDIVQEYPELNTYFDIASEIVGYDMADLVFHQEEKLNQTEYTQPAIITVEKILTECLKEAGIEPDYVLGLSLGEYAALMTSGALTYEQTMSLIKERGRLMEQAVPAGLGKMVAVMNTDRSVIESCCEEARLETNQYVSPANYNTQKQIVIGGDEVAVDLAVEKLKESGVKKMIPLKVSGPFHTALMIPASEAFAEYLGPTEFGPMRLPVISNTTARPHVNEQVKETLLKQIYSPVKWQDSIEYLISQGVDTFIEVGPGKTLSSFMRQIDRKMTCYRVDDLQTLKETIEAIKGE